MEKILRDFIHRGLLEIFHSERACLCFVVSKKAAARC